MLNKILKNYFPKYLADGALFSKMADAPWIAFEAGLEMDIAYLSSYSGIKFSSEIVDDFTTDGVLDQQALANLLWKLYGKNWQKLWDGFMQEYNPLDNYSIEENYTRETVNDRTIDRDISENGSVNSTDKLDSTDTTTQTGETKDNGTVTTDYGKNTKSDTQDDIYSFGFNSSSAVPTTRTIEDSTVQESGKDVVTTDDTVTTKLDTTRTLDSNDVVNSTSSNKTEDDTKDNQKENENAIKTRKGNVGQNTYQELLKQEFDLWKWNFFLRVFEDCDRIIALPIFGNICRHIISVN